MKQHAQAAERNALSILGVLERYLTREPARVLEIGSGTGQHAVRFARRLAHLIWQPSDADPVALASIRAYAAEASLPNLRPPIVLDVRKLPWPVAESGSDDPIGAVVSINMIHIAPVQCCEALIRGASQVLDPGGRLIIYGPFSIDGRFDAPSNARFDQALRARNPLWGVRDLTTVSALASSAGLEPIDRIVMPANNLTVIFEKSAE